MAFNVNQFRSQMTGDGARPNLFEVSMPFPGFSNPGDAQQKLTFMCKTAQLPGTTVGVVPVQYFGRELKFAGNRTFQDWTITVINDEDFVVRNAFERWLNGINSHAANLQSAPAALGLGYKRDARVTQFAKNGRALKSYNFIGVFPTELSDIALDWGSNDAIEEYTVNLSYQWWEADDGSTDRTAITNTGE